MATVKEKLKQLQDHLAFIEKYEGGKIYGFNIRREYRKSRDDWRLYAAKRVNGRLYNVYLSQEITSLEDAKKKILDKIRENDLPESLIDKGVQEG